MLNRVGERTPPLGTPVLNCVVSICCVGFASLDEFDDCTCNVGMLQFSN